MDPGPVRGGNFTRKHFGRKILEMYDEYLTSSGSDPQTPRLIIEYPAWKIIAAGCHRSWEIDNKALPPEYKLKGNGQEEVKVHGVCVFRGRHFTGLVHDSNYSTLSDGDTAGRWCAFDYGGERRFGEILYFRQAVAGYPDVAVVAEHKQQPHNGPIDQYLNVVAGERGCIHVLPVTKLLFQCGVGPYLAVTRKTARRKGRLRKIFQTSLTSSLVLFPVGGGR